MIANEFVRATEDIDFLIPDEPPNANAISAALESLGARLLKTGEHPSAAMVAERSHLRLDCAESGILDLLEEGSPPLDFETVYASAHHAELRGVPVAFAGLASIVAFKRLANRPKDRLDLEALKELHGELPGS